MPAPTALRPVLDDLVHRPCRQQRPTLALVPRLSTLPSPRGILAPPRCAVRRIGARWSRGVPRVALQPALELGDALVLVGYPRRERLHLRSQPDSVPRAQAAPRIRP